MRVLPCGPDAVLVELADGPAALAYLNGLQAAPIDGVVEMVPAARTVLLRGASPAVMARVAQAARGVVPVPPGQSTARQVTIETTYDGEDLGDAAAHLGMSVEAMIARHQELEWTVAFDGFSPGFAYMTCEDPSWSVPRRSSPRTRVPAGSIALAGGYTGSYPTPSPGGWQLIGHTDAPLWDIDRDPPALLTPGTRVKFLAVGSATGSPAGAADARGGAR